MQFVTLKSPFKIALVIALFLFGSSAVTNAQQKKPANKKGETATKDVRKKIPENQVAQKVKQKIKPPVDSVEESDETENSGAQKPAENKFRAETVRNIATDNVEGEDLKIRRAAIDALGNRAGTVVVMEVKTGKILTIVNQNWAIRESFKPCSTIKLVTGIAGTNESLINENGRIPNEKTRFDLNDALAFSDNLYFQKIGKNLGSVKMIEYARKLGLGQKTGINAEGETSGRLPFGNENLRIYSHGDDFEVTPLQLAVMVSAINNDGKIVVPRIPRTSSEKINFRGFTKGEVELPEKSVESVITGMRGAARYGTARRGTHPDFRIAGKTGSCIEHGSWVGLFASVAPLENPKYAVVVITRGSGERGRHAAMIAGQIYEALRPRIFADEAPVLLAEFKEKSEIKNEKPIIAGRNEKPSKIISDENSTGLESAKSNTAASSDSGFSSIVIEYKKETAEEAETDAPTQQNANPPVTQITRPRIVKTDQR